MRDGNLKYILFAVCATMAAALSVADGTIPLALLGIDDYSLDDLLQIFLDLYRALYAPLL